MQHTPRPWTFAPSSNLKNGTDWCDILSTGGTFAPSYVGEALRQDAALIAAAPDLLIALEELFDTCTQFGCEAEFPETLERARIAIDKARS
jgi:hypothetical protein